MMDIWCTGAMLLGLCVAIANFKILTFSFSHSRASLFFIFGSIGVYILSFVIVNTLEHSELNGLFGE